MLQSQQMLQKLKYSIQDLRQYNYNIKKTIAELKYAYPSQHDYEYQQIYKDIKQDLKDKINELANVIAEVLKISQFKLVSIIKHVEMTQIQISSKKRLLSDYEQNIQHMQNQIGKLAVKCTDLEMQLNQLRVKNKSLLQQFSTLSQFSNKKILELQNQKRLHKKQSSSSLQLPAQFNLQSLTKKPKKQIGILPKQSHGENKQTLKYKSPQRYNLKSKHIESSQDLQSTSKKYKDELSFGCVPLKKIIHQSQKKTNNHKHDYEAYQQNSNDMNRRLEYLLTTLSNAQQTTTSINNNSANKNSMNSNKQSKNATSTEVKVFKI